MTQTIASARIFDGHGLAPGFHTITVNGGLIAGIERSGPPDGEPLMVLPGLIDAHVHLKKRDDLASLARSGVTTALDMGSWPPALVDELAAAQDACDTRSAGTPAIGPGGRHTQIPGMPADAVVRNPGEARALVAARVAEGRDYIKIVLEAPGQGGPDEATARALVTAAHDAGKQVVAHASALGAIALAQRAGADVLTHAPLDGVLDPAEVARVRAAGRVVVPTLAQMRTQASSHVRPGLSYDAARDSVTRLHEAGVTILAGTDANDLPVLGLPHGPSLHTELQLLVDAGLRPVEALAGATARTAAAFGLPDRGVIGEGRRADLILVAGDPTARIADTLALRGVWIAGRQVA